MNKTELNQIKKQWWDQGCCFGIVRGMEEAVKMIKEGRTNEVEKAAQEMRAAWITSVKKRVKK